MLPAALLAAGAGEEDGFVLDDGLAFDGAAKLVSIVLEASLLVVSLFASSEGVASAESGGL